MSNQLSANTGDLWALSGQLFEMFEERENILANLRQVSTASAQGAALDESDAESGNAECMAELKAIEDGIQNFVIAKAKEVDELRDPLIALETAVKICREAANRETNRAMVLQNRYDKLKDFIKVAMEYLEASGYWKPKQSKKVESARGFLRLQGNGGTQPVEITDETMIPAGLMNYTITMPGDMWLAIERAIGTGPLLEMLAHRSKESKEPSKSRIAEALSQPCQTCGGIGSVCRNCQSLKELDCIACYGLPVMDPNLSNTCRDCGGSKLAGVPGARLAPRGSSVIVSK